MCMSFRFSYYFWKCEVKLKLRKYCWIVRSCGFCKCTNRRSDTPHPCPFTPLLPLHDKLPLHLTSCAALVSFPPSPITPFPFSRTPIPLPAFSHHSFCRLTHLRFLSSCCCMLFVFELFPPPFIACWVAPSLLKSLSHSLCLSSVCLYLYINVLPVCLSLNALLIHVSRVCVRVYETCPCVYVPTCMYACAHAYMCVCRKYSPK